jgi:hypothetical protein
VRPERCSSHSVCVIKIAMLFGININPTIILEAAGDESIGIDPFNYRKVAIGDSKRLVRHGELEAISFGEFPADFKMDADAGVAEMSRLA